MYNTLMSIRKQAAKVPEVRGQMLEAISLRAVARATAKLWRKHHLSYDQTKHVVEQARRELQLAAPRDRRRTVDRLDRDEVARLIEAAYRRSSRYGLMVKTLFYTGARVSEFVHIQVHDLHLSLDHPRSILPTRKGVATGMYRSCPSSRKNSARILLAAVQVMCLKAIAPTSTRHATYKRSCIRRRTTRAL